MKLKFEEIRTARVCKVKVENGVLTADMKEKEV